MVALERRLLRVTGTVQGVGFRPFVYRIAQRDGLLGWVRNDVHGVTIEAIGAADQVERFAHALAAEAPPAARVEGVAVLERGPAPEPLPEGFVIVASEDARDVTTAISADLPVCDDCLAELRERKQSIRDFLRRVETLGGFASDHAGHNGGQSGGAIRSQRSDRRGFVQHAGHEFFHRAFPPKRNFAGQQLEQRTSQGENIAANVGFLRVATLFWRDVVNGPQHLAGVGEVAFYFRKARQAHVQNFQVRPMRVFVHHH